MDEELEQQENEIEDYSQDSCECPMCNGDAYPLGSLGWTQYYRCENCGWEFSQ